MLNKLNSHNEIYDYLDKTLYVIHELGDKISNEKKIETIDNIYDVIQKLKKLESKPVEKTLDTSTVFNHLEYIVSKCLEIYQALRYEFPNEIFKKLCLLSIDENTIIKGASLEAASKIAKYIFWLEGPKDGRISYKIQLAILDEIEGWNSKDYLLSLNVITRISKEFLTPNFEGTSSSLMGITLHQGALPATDIVQEIRQRNIGMLKKIYCITETNTEKIQVLEALIYVTYQSRQANAEKIEKIILDDANNLIQYYASIVIDAENEVVMLIDEQLYRLAAWNKKGLNGLEELKLLIKKDEEYAIYKNFLGGVRLLTCDTDLKDCENLFDLKMDEYAKQVNEDNTCQWKERVLVVAKSHRDNNRHSFGRFDYFLYRVSEKMPSLAQDLICEHEQDLNPFLTDLVAGLWDSDRRELAVQILEKWIDQGKHLNACARVFGYVKDMDEQILKNIYRKVEGQNDQATLSSIIKSIGINFEKFKIGKPLFLSCVIELNKNNDFSWIGDVCYRPNSILEDLDESEWEQILEVFITTHDIEYVNDLEDLLSIFAKKYLSAFLQFFDTRIKMNEKDNSSCVVIPFRLNTLSKDLEPQAKKMIDAIKKKILQEEDKYYPNYIRLLRALVPKLGGNKINIEELLQTILRSKHKNRAELVLDTLNCYAGDNSLHTICQEFIIEYSDNQQYIAEMFGILSETGVVQGDYKDTGLVTAYESKKHEIQAWENDERKPIRDFVGKYEKYLSRKIEYLKMDRDERYEMRKRDFGEDED